MRFIPAFAVGLWASAVAARVASRSVVERPIVAHYMVGELKLEEVVKDIDAAKDLGLHGFALNFDRFMPYSETTVQFLFDHADYVGNFNLFFSFDFNPGFIKKPVDVADYFKKYTGRTSYLRMRDPSDNKNKPLLSTYGGEGYTAADWNDLRNRVGSVLIVPGFSQYYSPTTNFFNNARGRAIDGVFNWNSWPQTFEGKVAVSAATDKTFQTAAGNADTGKKLFMMGISPYQWKHYAEQNWYRRGEDNLENRFGQILERQPDIVQLQTWNDAGEGHYMGLLHPTPLDKPTKAIVEGYDHTGYWQILKPFIAAWKAGDRTTANMRPTGGKAVQGTFWHHTLTVGGSCYDDDVQPSGKPSNDIKTAAEDAVSGVVLVPAGKTNLVAVVNVGSRKLNQMNLRPGFNKFKFTGLEELVPGKVQLEVWDGSTMVGGGYGSIEVTDRKAICNYQFQVVGLPA